MNLDPEKYRRYKADILRLMGVYEEWKGGTELRIDGRKIESYHTDRQIAKELGITPEEAKEIRTIAFKEALMEYGVPEVPSKLMEARFKKLFKSA